MDNKKKYTIYFDGICNVCDGLIQFIKKRDKEKIFTYQSLQSPQGEKLLADNPQLQNVDSIIVAGNDTYYYHAEAILKIASAMPGFVFRFVNIIKIFPTPLRTRMYKWFAKNRYKWFGKKDICTINVN